MQMTDLTINERSSESPESLPLFVPATFRDVHVKKLKGAPLAVFLIYVSRADIKERIAWPSIGGLARDTGLSPNSVKKARRFLMENGYLEEFTQDRGDSGAFGKKKFRVACYF
jgi:hypothetical protein